MEINEFMSIAIIETITSFIINYIKKKLGTTSTGTKSLTVALSSIIGGFYVWLRGTSYFESVVLILTTASTIYALLMPKG